MQCSERERVWGLCLQSRPGHCATHCSSDADCPSGKGCAIAPCELYGCGFPLERECRPKCTATDSSSCGAYRCELDTLICAAECYNDADCAAGYACNLNEHTCEASGKGVTCTQDSQCGAFACSFNGKCFSACSSNADCGDGAVCEGLNCTWPCTTENDPVCGGQKCSVSSQQPLCETSCYNNLNCQPGYHARTSAASEHQLVTELADSLCGVYACDYNSGHCYAGCSNNGHVTKAASRALVLPASVTSRRVRRS